MIFLAATESDQYRKPALGMWKYCLEKVFTGQKVDMEGSFYCGDAAGRPASGTRKKDFTDTDIKFAKNIGIRFLTPEQFFLDEKEEVAPKIDSFFKKVAKQEDGPAAK